MHEQDSAAPEPVPAAEYECSNCRRGRCARCNDPDCTCCYGGRDDETRYY